jgi:anti-sigma factor RsiW
MFSLHVVHLLAAYAERQLDPNRHARVAHHLATCDACREALDEIRRGIALASELEPVAMPPDVAARVREEIVNSKPAEVARSTASNWWWKAAAAMVAALLGVAVYWQVNRPWAELHAAALPPTDFEREGRELHDLIRDRRDALEYQTADDADAWRWLEAQGAPVTSLRPVRSVADKARFVPLGVTVQRLGGARTSVLEYRIDGRPVTLMLARQRDVSDAPSAGLWSKRVTHRRDERGVNTLTWTVGGGTYVLVSELDGYGQQACFICHTDSRFQEPIAALHLQ